ncbi:MAG TPA: cobyrinate a,c-diamide synthase [Nitrospirota bacterium]|nr:cobyrinate a,c-diamide synthase [Nitrospirota bacterium]
MQTIPRLVLSATRGGLGKTTLSIGIITAWRKSGRQVAVFKKGPDFIDAGWLGVAAGKPCYNLDLFMMGQERIKRSFREHSKGCDAVVIEGNRGLFDGVDESGTYSTARLASLLKAPVALIVDCTKSTTTVAATVLGCRQYDPSVNLAGVILNNVSSTRHENVIRKAIAQSSGLPVVGAVPRQRGDAFPERHMGLTPFHEHPEVQQALFSSASLVERYLDLETLWSVACAAPEIESAPSASSDDPFPEQGDRVVIGVIRDRAFQFYYPDNLEALERQGASLKEINALDDRALPGDIDALYIGGGFPETQAAELAANESFCTSVRNAAEKGLPVYAECGGLIYLGRSLTVGGERYPMTAVLPVDFVLEKRPQAHGYSILKSSASSTFLEKGVGIRGHEFHYSRVSHIDGQPLMAYHVNRGSGIDGRGDGIIYKNVVAAYTHIHSLATPQWAPALIRIARKHRNAQLGQTEQGRA